MLRLATWWAVLQASTSALFSRDRCFIRGADKIYFLHTASDESTIAGYYCTLESATRLHPSMPVCLLSAHFSAGELPELPNLVLVRYNSEAEMLKHGFGLQSTYGRWFNVRNGISTFRPPHWFTAQMVKPALARALLQRFGGLYLDLDAITRAPLIGPQSLMPENSLHVGEEAQNCQHQHFLTDAAVLRFEAGSVFLRHAEQQFLRHYNGSKGPGLSRFTADELPLRLATRRDSRSGCLVADDKALHVLPRLDSIKHTAGCTKRGGSSIGMLGQMALIGVQGSVVFIILLYFQRRSRFMLPSVRMAVKILLLILVASVAYGNWAIVPHAPTTMGIGPVFVINLPESTEKLRRFRAQMEKQDIKCSVWPGLRIRNWNDPVYRKLIDQGLARPPEEGTRELGNAGVAAAHIMLWQHLLQLMTQPDELALVFEDDEQLRPHFMPRLNEVLQSVQGQPLDHININPLRPTGRLVSKRFGLRKIEMLSYFDPKKMNNLWTSAYAISRAGAELLLQELKQRQYDFSNPRTQIDYAVAYAAVSNRRGAFYSLPSQSLSHHDELKSARQDANGYRES